MCLLNKKPSENIFTFPFIKYLFHLIVNTMFSYSIHASVSTIFSKTEVSWVVHSRDDKEVGVSHEVKSPKNQPQFFQITMG